VSTTDIQTIYRPVMLSHHHRHHHTFGKPFSVFDGIVQQQSSHFDQLSRRFIGLFGLNGGDVLAALSHPSDIT